MQKNTCKQNIGKQTQNYGKPLERKNKICMLVPLSQAQAQQQNEIPGTGYQQNDGGDGIKEFVQREKGRRRKTIVNQEGEIVNAPKPRDGWWIYPQDRMVEKVHETGLNRSSHSTIRTTREGVIPEIHPRGESAEE